MVSEQEADNGSRETDRKKLFSVEFILFRTLLTRGEEEEEEEEETQDQGSRLHQGVYAVICVASRWNHN